MISNGANTPINENSGTVPQMGYILDGWLQKITVSIIVKTVTNNRVIETLTEFDYQGVWQPMSKSELVLRPANQRHWKWFTTHSKIALPYNVDDKVTFQGITYRVKDEDPYGLYGYYKYNLIEDYTA